MCQLAFQYLSDKNAAEDVVQGVFGQLWDKRERLEWGDKMVHYLYRATKNNAIDLLRKQRFSAELDEEHLNTPDNGGALDENALKAIQLNLIKESLSTLPDRCREIFMLQKMNGLTYREIAEELGISVKTVENQMVKALAMIRDYYEKQRHKYGI